MEDLNAEFEGWRTTIANPREHATTKRIVDEHFAEETPYLLALPAHLYGAVLTEERRISQKGMVAVGGKLRWGGLIVRPCLIFAVFLTRAEQDSEIWLD